MYRIHPLGAALAQAQFERLEEYIAVPNENYAYPPPLLHECAGQAH
ncbi:hypothetical protein [Thermogemmatispora sp.]